MFTGIITDVGTVLEVSATPSKDTVFRIASRYEADGIDLGASICHQGVCLTVVEKGPRPEGGAWWRVQVSAESLSRTNLGSWQVGTRINLERALKLGDELGGHMVSGHVDGIGEILSVHPENESWRLKVKAPHELARYIAEKGSVAVDGISLTVNEVEDDVFGLNIIPHTWLHTTLGQVQAGTLVNLEIDQVARYVARFISYGR
jgi:riboflavin synthase